MDWLNDNMATYAFIFNFHPTNKIRAAPNITQQMASESPENNIIGPNPLAHDPSILSAPEIGVPVKPAMKATQTAPNLSKELIFATQAMNKLTNAPLKKPIKIVTAMIAPSLVDTVHITTTKMVSAIVNTVTTLNTPKKSAIIPGMILPNTDAVFSIEMR